MGKCNEKPHYYFGIDLGTTNSVLAWAKVDPSNLGETPINPQAVEIKMPARTNYRANGFGELLPSCVYFKDNQPNPIVGMYAKGMLISQPKNVVKSIKTKMGTAHSMFGYKPSEISARILQTLVDGVPIGFPRGDLLNEVVIGIPASFEEGMCDATLEAAKNAGFINPILIHEPIAALYDYSNQQNKGLFPPGAAGIEFSTDEPKLILVFDLGGGTLDVSLHQVSLGSEQKLCVNEIAVSRYTSIGGDNFDNLLAEHFLDIYQRSLGILHNRDLLKPQFQEYAEQAKITLSAKIERDKLRGTFNPKTTQIEFTSLNRYQKQDGVFNYNLTLCKYEEIIAPLLAHNLTLKSVAMFSPSVPPDNIIDPVLDVLKEGQNSLDSKTIPEPDAVILNGAMTRLHTIQKRLADFFPCVSISSIGDQDVAVARGAVVEHYNRYNP